MLAGAALRLTVQGGRIHGRAGLGSHLLATPSWPPERSLDVSWATVRRWPGSVSDVGLQWYLCFRPPSSTRRCTSPLRTGSSVGGINPSDPPVKRYLPTGLLYLPSQLAQLSGSEAIQKATFPFLFFSIEGPRISAKRPIAGQHRPRPLIDRHMQLPS